MRTHRSERGGRSPPDRPARGERSWRSSPGRTRTSGIADWSRQFPAPLVRVRPGEVTRPAGTEAFIDLKGIPPVAGVPPGKQPSVLMRVRALTQIARTLIGLSDIARVRVRV